MPRFLLPLIPFAFFLLIDMYAFQGFRAGIPNRVAHIAYWVASLLIYSLFIYGIFSDFRTWQFQGKAYISGLFIVAFVFKFILIWFVALDDLLRLGKLALRLFQNPEPAGSGGEPITRSEFINRLGLLVAAIPFGAMVWGAVRNPYNYQVNKVMLPIANLPDALVGTTIAQISDIHTGSFTAMKPIQKAIDLINGMNADFVFFTGDLVNYRAVEALPYIDMFKQLKAKLGIFSVKGNHDYGDYFDWDSPDDKVADNKLMEQIHSDLGWDLLLNEHRIIEKEGHKLAIIGVENWHKGRQFKQYGDLGKAYQGCQDCAVKLLLSHDPSHWQGEVLPQYKDINATFSGHTHGLQFGINFPGFKWSPVQYAYNEWKGLYSQNQQHLYVNTGFGFVAYPGRVGFLPEITLFTLQKA
jgi:predicted MPP superfamily phosphohydrolase